MRADMQKVIVERPRRAGSLRVDRRSKNVFATTVEEALDLDLRRPHPRRDKELNENLAPLRRFLHRNVGRPWDKVYSEIRARLDPRKATGLHILQHLEHMVEQNCWIADRRVYTIGRWSGVHQVRGLYVHPRTGLLSRTR